MSQRVFCRSMRHSHGARKLTAVATLLAAFVVATPALADDEDDEDGGLTQEQVSAWLDSKALPSDIDVEDEPEAPPPEPRDHGFVIEAGGGALGHLGDLGTVSPTSPWFFTRFGWEPTGWVMLLVSGDVALSSTSNANPPPDPRGYALWGIGGGVRFTLEPTDWFGLFAQGEIGFGEVTEDVLLTYGYEDADSISPYFGALLGFEWYQINPHLAIVLHGGVRNYAQGLDRQLSGTTPLAWIGSLALQYTF